MEPGPDNIHLLLTALVDGELDAAQTDAVLQYTASRPELEELLARHRTLVNASARVLAKAPSIAPEKLRRQIEQLNANYKTAAIASRKAGNSLRGFTLPAVAACFCFVAGGFTAYYFQRPGKSTTVVSAPIIPASVVSRIEFLHADCARLADFQHAGPFPAGQLSDDMQNDLARDKPFPDLNSIGFGFVGAGPCGRPLERTIHLLYRSKKPESRAAISILVQEYSGQYALEVGQLYTLASPQSPFPAVAWRSEKVMYFLVTDNDETERNALKLIRLAPRK